jgi:hypothetical protein
MSRLQQLIDFYMRGRHRLDAIQLLPLGSNLNEAVALYGEPLKSEPLEETTEISVHTFQIGKYHQAVAMEWQERTQSITYWSAKSDPSRDLRCMLESYKDDSRWTVLEEGYWYQREDGMLKLWCSVAPVIGVAYSDFLSTKADLNTASELNKLGNLDDPRWASDNAIFELQRRRVTGGDRGLLDFARRSNRIVVSGDGRDVIIVRDHHAYDVENGFIELNCPPESGEADSTQVINFFTWSEDASSWSKAPLPRDAVVESIFFEGGFCHIEFRRTTTGRLISLSGSARSIRSLCANLLDTPLQNERIWEALHAEEAKQEGGETGNKDNV